MEADPTGLVRWSHLATEGKLAYTRGRRPQVECLLCAVLAGHRDVEKLLIITTKLWAVSANLYPYNPGHLLIFPRRHTEDIRSLKRAEQRELHDVQACALDVLDAMYSPHGFNVGFNLGRSAGASVRHLHLHVVPRYDGELGFLDLLSQTRTVVEAPRTTVRRLRARFRRAWNG